MTTGLRQFTRTVAQLGWCDTALYWLARRMAHASAGRWTIYRYRYVAQYLGDTCLPGRRGADIDIRFHDAQAPLPGCPRPAPVIAARHAQGAQCLAAWRQRHLAGMLWLIDHGYQEDEVRARYRLASPHACWDFDVWVHPDERLGLTFARLWDTARQHLRARGVRWSCSRISAFNPASLRAHAALGIVPLGSALFVRCGSWQWMFASMAPRFHLSRSPASFPLMTFDTGALAGPPAKELP
ncbi:MAG: hypothetical protein ABW069_22630 [Duganella sp.]